MAPREGVEWPGRDKNNAVSTPLHQKRVGGRTAISSISLLFPIFALPTTNKRAKCDNNMVITTNHC